MTQKQMQSEETVDKCTALLQWMDALLHFLNEEREKRVYKAETKAQP